MLPESISLIIGIVSALLGIISFFAAIIFYINGNRLNRQSEKTLSNIDAKINLIQEYYGKVVDRSFDITKDHVLSLSKQLASQLNVLEESLREAIKSKLVSLDSKELDHVSQQPVSFKKLEDEIENLVEEKIGRIKQTTEKLIHLSGSEYKYDYIEWRFLKALQYGSGNVQTVQKYFKSYGIETTESDILNVASKLTNEGLIEKDTDFVKKAKLANSFIIEPYWHLSNMGQYVLMINDK